MIEAWWRSLKHHWLFLHSLDSVATVRRLVAFYVEEHNRVLPHSAFRGQTPDEMYFGTGAAVPGDLTSRATAARRARVKANRSAACETCPSVDTAACSDSRLRRSALVRPDRSRQWLYTKVAVVTGTATIRTVSAPPADAFCMYMQLIAFATRSGPGGSFLRRRGTLRAEPRVIAGASARAAERVDRVGAPRSHSS